MEIPNVTIRRDFDAKALNLVLNDPSVRPELLGAADGPVDVTALAENPDNIVLMGEYGGVLLIKLLNGHYEVHTQVVEKGRGAWALGMIQAAQRWLFTHTDAWEVVTRVPVTNKAALGLTIKAGMVKEFDALKGVRLGDKQVDAAIYRLTLQSWASKAPGMVERGRRLIHWLSQESGVPIEQFDTSDTALRYTAIALEMITNGQPAKGVFFYSRWAWLAERASIKLVSVDPVGVRLNFGSLRLADGELEFVPWRQMVN